MRGGLYGLPAGELEVLADPRTYYRAWTPGGGAGGNTDETPIASPYSGGALRGSLTPYAQAVLSTPGLMNWWRLGKTISNPYPTAFTKPPYFANSAGCATLRTQGAGSASLVRGLIPGDTDGACSLDGSSWLDAFDYKVWVSNAEIISVEAWVYLNSIATEFGIVSDWGSTSPPGQWGWMLYCPGSSGDLRLYSGDSQIVASGVLSTKKLFHIVGVWGGQEAPTPDYYTRIYVNGKNVASGLALETSYNMINSLVQPRCQIGAYNDGVSNGGFLNGIVDEVAVYNRMLQPEEIRQHYNAAFARRGARP